MTRVKKSAYIAGVNNEGPDLPGHLHSLASFVHLQDHWILLNMSMTNRKGTDCADAQMQTNLDIHCSNNSSTVSAQKRYFTLNR